MKCNLLKVFSDTAASSSQGVAHLCLSVKYRYSLLRGVQELVLAAAAVTDPYPWVSPEAADGVDVPPLQPCDLHCVHILQQLGVHLKDRHGSW